MSNDRSGWTTIVARNPQISVDFVAGRRDTPAQAEAACKQLRRGGFPARCEPWKPTDSPSQPWRPATTRTKGRA